MTFDLDHSRALLARTPAVAGTLLRGLPKDWTCLNEGPDTWSPLEVVAHLVHCEESNWLPRVRALLEHGTNQGFPPFDRFGHLERYRDTPLDDLLNAFVRLRAESIDELARLAVPPEILERRGLHPGFGVVTLSNLLATWTVHDLTHLNQIVRVMAKGYGEAVGPWQAYLSILR